MVRLVRFSQPGPKDRLTNDEVQCLLQVALAQHDLKASSPAQPIYWVRDKDFQPGRMN